MPHYLIKEKLINLIEWTFKREGSPYIACNERQTSEDTKRYKLWSVLSHDRRPMGTNTAPFVGYERDFMTSLSALNQIIEA